MQDSYENPTPTPPEASAGGDTPPVEPTIETTPEPATEPAAAPDLGTTPASTPAEATETVPTIDASASDPTPATNTAPASDPTPSTDAAPSSNPFLSSTNSTPAAAPVTPSASTPITPVLGEKKSNKGIILGVVIGVIVLAIIGICVFLFLNSNNKKSDNNVSNNGASQEEKSEKKEEKKEEKEEPKTSAKSIEVGYAGKSFTVTDSFADTIKNAAKSFDIYYEDDNIDLVKIEDIDEYLKGVTPSTTSVHVYITNEEGDDVIEIVGIADYNDYGKESVAYSALTIREVWLAAYDSESYTLGNVSLTLNKTTVDDIKKAFGEKFDYSEDTNVYSYKDWNRFDIDLFINDNEDTLNFVTFEPTFE